MEWVSLCKKMVLSASTLLLADYAHRSFLTWALFFILALTSCLKCLPGVSTRTYKATKKWFSLLVVSISHNLSLNTYLISSSCTLLSIFNPNIRQYESKRTNHDLLPWLQHWISQFQATWHLELVCYLNPRIMFALAKAHCRVILISPQTTNSPLPLAYLNINNQRMTLANVAELKVLRSWVAYLQNSEEKRGDRNVCCVKCTFTGKRSAG